MATAVVSGESVPRRWQLPDRLPDLKGKWLTAYCVVWTALLIIAIAASADGALISYQRTQLPSLRSYGLLVDRTDSGLTVANAFGDDARRSGIRSTDSLTMIDGVSAGSLTRAELQSVIGNPDRTTVSLQVRTRSGESRGVELTRSEATDLKLFREAGISRTLFNLSALAGTLLPCLLLPAAVLLFVRRRREIVPALLSVAFLILGGWADQGAGAIQDAGVAEGLRIFVVDAGWTALLIAAVSFPNGRLSSRWGWAAIAIMPLCFANDLVWKQPLGFAFGGIAFGLTGLALMVSYRHVRSTAERQQYRLAFFGFFVGIIIELAAVPFSIVAYKLIEADPRWYVWGTTFVNPVYVAGLVAMALGLMVSILRYRLYDADSVIGRSAAYGILTLGFVGLFAGAEKLAEIVGERYFEHSVGIAAGAIGAAVAAACIVPLHNRVHRWAERRFQKPLIRLREGLPECVSDLRESAPVDQLLAAVMKRVETGVRSTREAVLLVDGGNLALAGTLNVAVSAVEEWRAGWTAPFDEHAVDCDRRDAIFPLRVRLCIESAGEPETIGWLLLGPRPDGSFFGRDEREALEHVAGPVARAIHIAQLREEREEQTEKRIGALEALIERLAAAIGGRPGAAPA
jgi:hypothetical protein